MSYLRDRGYDYALEEVWRTTADHQMRAASSTKPSHTNCTTTACKFCGKPELQWRRVDNRWRLFERATGVMHVCSH